MTPRRVIIPAAGEAVRFGGVPKEMLPIAEGETLLQRSVRLAKMIGKPVIISNPRKYFLHQRLCPGENIEVRNDFLGGEMWESMLVGMQEGVAGGLILPDTVTTIRAGGLEAIESAKFCFGLFETRNGGDFSVVHGDGIYTKKADLGPSVRHAWGMCFWSADVTDFFLNGSFPHFDRAFEAAMEKFKWQAFGLPYYYDLGTFEAYREFLLTWSRKLCPPE